MPFHFNSINTSLMLRSVDSSSPLCRGFCARLFGQARPRIYGLVVVEWSSFHSFCAHLICPGQTLELWIDRRLRGRRSRHCMAVAPIKYGQPGPGCVVWSSSWSIGDSKSFAHKIISVFGGGLSFRCSCFSGSP